MSFVSNLVGFTKKSQFAKLGRSDTYNMFVEQKGANEQGFSVVLLPMPGYREAFTFTSTRPSGTPQGTFRCSRGFNGKPCIYGVWGKKLYLLNERSDAVFEVADIAGSGKVTFCETSGYGKASPHLVVCDGVNVYAVDTTLSPIRQKQTFSTVQMPLKYPDSTVERVTPSWVAYMYGYMVVGAKDTDMFYRSVQFPFEGDSEDVMDLEKTDGYGRWTFSEWQPDNTVIGCSNGSRLFTLGERSFQVFTYQASTENPFVSPDTAAQNIGIKNGATLAMYGDSIFWLGSSSMGDGSIYRMDSAVSPERISTDEIERMISRYDWKTAYAFVYKWFSHPLYVISFPSDGITLCYDIREKGWSRMGSRGADGNETTYRYMYPIIGNDGTTFLQGENCVVAATEDTWFEHDGTPILRKRAGGIISSDNRPFKIGSVKLITNNGDYRNVLDHSPLITFRYSRDGTTWVASNTRSLGPAGRYDYDTVFRNLGKSRYFSVEVGTSENIGFALYGLDVSGVTCAK